MGLSILTSTASLNAQNNVNRLNKENIQSLGRLSSGQKAIDGRGDSSSVVIGSRINADIVALKQVLSNTSHATSFLQTVESSYASIGEVLSKQTVLANKAASGNVSDNNRIILNEEFKGLTADIDKILNGTSFNNNNIFEESIKLTSIKSREGVSVVGSEIEGLLKVKYNRKAEKFIAFADGSKLGVYDITKEKSNSKIDFSIKGVDFEVDTNSFNLTKSFGANGLVVNAEKDYSRELSFKVGIGVRENSDVKVIVNKANSRYLGLEDVNISTQESSKQALEIIKSAQDSLSLSRSNVVSSLSRLDFAYSNNIVALENKRAAKDGLVGVDVAHEVVKYTTNQYVLKSGVFLMAQANNQTGKLLDLIK